MGNPVADNSAQKMVPADCVSVLLMALGNTSISKAQYELMSALDGSRTASSFEHQFRSITAKAKELKTRVDKGEEFAPITPVKKRGAKLTSETPKSSTKKRVAVEDDGSPQAAPKKRKPTAMPKKTSPALGGSASPDSGAAEEFNKGCQEMIKQEKEWMDEFV